MVEYGANRYTKKERIKNQTKITDKFLVNIVFTGSLTKKKATEPSTKLVHFCTTFGSRSLEHPRMPTVPTVPA